MATLIHTDSLTEAWLSALECLNEQGGETLNLVTTIDEPGRIGDGVVAVLDDWLIKKRKQRVGTVANTIFPVAYLRGPADRQEFYDRYLSRMPRLRKLKGNSHGTYFGRLIEYPATADVKRGQTMNQLEGIIQKLEKQLRSPGPKRFAYQAQIFVPGRDDGSLMGFPCLSFVSFQLESGRLCLTAMYRNQYYFERALGNFVGLARLQRFVADETGLETGSLTVHACHAEIDVLGRGQVEELILACRGNALVDVAA